MRVISGFIVAWIALPSAISVVDSQSLPSSSSSSSSSSSLASSSWGTSFDPIEEEEENILNRLLEPVKDVGNSERRTSIINGNEAEIGDYPWFASIVTRFSLLGFGVICGGSLISSQYVLTAAHCGDRTGEDIYIGAYKYRSTEGGAQRRKCKQWYADPDFQYEGTAEKPQTPFQFDYALCKLDSPVTIAGPLSTLVLNTNNEYPPPGTDTISIGFGVVNSGENIPADILQEVTIPTISNEDEGCIEENGDRPANTCTFDPTEPLDRKDTCKGDSGGPSFVRLNNGDGTFKDVHIGITSFGTFGCSGTAVNARTSFSIDWVKSIVCEDPDGQDADFCQTASPSSSPTSSPSSFQASSPTCTDDPGFEANGKKCGGFLDRKRNRKCKKIIDGTLVADSCPSLCKRSCSSCKNKSGKIKLKNGKRFNCKKIRKKKKCKKKTKAGPLANEFCPAACKIEGC